MHSRFAFLSVFALFISSGCFNTVLVTPMLPGSSSELKQVVVHSDSEESCLGGPAGERKFLMIPIGGVIADESSFSRSGTSPAGIRRILALAEKDASIRGVILKIDSPGGTVTASDLVYRMILRYAQTKKLPVYSHIESLGASGGYYVAMSSSYINATPTASVGSIGVIMRGFNAQGLLEKIGVKYRTIESGKNKDTSSPFRDLRPDEQEYLQSQILKAYEGFLGIVLKSRGKLLGEEQLRKIADGRVYDARQAHELKLIDSVEYIEDFIAIIKRKENIQHIKIVSYMPEDVSRANLYDVSAPSSEFSLQEALRALMGLQRNGLFYLWKLEL